MDTIFDIIHNTSQMTGKYIETHDITLYKGSDDDHVGVLVSRLTIPSPEWEREAEYHIHADIGKLMRTHRVRIHKISFWYRDGGDVTEIIRSWHVNAPHGLFPTVTTIPPIYIEPQGEPPLGLMDNS